MVHASQTALPTPYAAVCNPPRKAKRIGVLLPEENRERESESEYMRLPGQASMNGAPAPALPSAHITQGPRQDNPASSHPNGIPDTPPKRRGRKPGTLSRSARESQRKMNHSRIEKARRLKINDALAALRELVPQDFDRSLQDDDDDDVPNGKGKKEEREREFKLEVLERAVLYMRFLVQKVDLLEDAGGVGPLCKDCSFTSGKPDVPSSTKRRLESNEASQLSTLMHKKPKRGNNVKCHDTDAYKQDWEEDMSEDDDMDASEVTDEEVQCPPVSIMGNRRLSDTQSSKTQLVTHSSSSHSSSPRPSLPSISSWLNNEPIPLGWEAVPSHHPHSRPYFSSTPNLPPSTTTHSITIPSAPMQLPSPPMSGRALLPSAQILHNNNTLRGLGPLPALSLPPPHRASISSNYSNYSQTGSTSPVFLGSPYVHSTENYSKHAMSVSPLLLASASASSSSVMASGVKAPSYSQTQTQISSPSWTHEDERAASVLLRISSNASSSSSSSLSNSSPTLVSASASPLIPSDYGYQRHEVRHHDASHLPPPAAVSRKVTPSSLLGIVNS